jgi:hypothetical protein
VDAPALALDLDPGEAGAGFRGRLAGLDLWSSRPLGGARPAPRRPPLPALGRAERALARPEAIDSAAEGAPASVARSAGGERTVAWPDGERFAVAADGSAVVRVGGARGSGERTLERALGVPVALALALRGRFLLHASAVERGGRALALTADAGGGKSTLAAAAARGPGWRRIADDQLPVILGAAPAALPHFPQLQLAPEESYPEPAPPELPLAAVVLLARGAGAEPIGIERLEPTAAALALARATVAARAFDGELLDRHFAACAAGAAALAVVRLRYPSGVDRLGEVLAALAARFG